MDLAQTGRYGLAHGDIIAQLLMRTDLTKIEQFDHVMAHVRALEDECTTLHAALELSREAHSNSIAERDALDRQLNHIITGE